MRNNGKKLAAVVLVLVLLCAVMTACGNSSKDDPVVGTWELSQVNVLGQDVAVDEFLKIANMEEKGIPVITFNGDNSVHVDIMGTKGKGKWEVKDGKYIVTDGTDAKLTFALEENTLSVEESGATLKFEKKTE